MIKKIDIDHAFAWFGEGQLLAVGGTIFSTSENELAIVAHTEVQYTMHESVLYKNLHRLVALMCAWQSNIPGACMVVTN